MMYAMSVGKRKDKGTMVNDEYAQRSAPHGRSYVVYTFTFVYGYMDVDGNIMGMSYWGNCPICKGPLEEIYYGGGVTKHECRNCVKNFVTSITSEYEN